jgi:hypothetical protein
VEDEKSFAGQKFGRIIDFNTLKHLFDGGLKASATIKDSISAYYW